MAIVNGYCTLAELKAALRVADSIDDRLLELAIESARGRLTVTASACFSPRPRREFTRQQMFTH